MKECLLLFFFLCSTNYIHSQCPVPKIITPNGSEELLSGSIYSVKYYYKDLNEWNSDWDWDTIEEYVNFSYSVDNGQSWEFIDSIEVDSFLASIDTILSFEWEIPFEISDSCKIKIVKYGTTCWDESDNVFKISNTTTASEITNEPLDIYPNPISRGNQVIVSNIKKDPIHVQLYDINGKVKRVNIINSKDEIRISTDNLNSGIYILLLGKGFNRTTHKIVIE